MPSNKKPPVKKSEANSASAAAKRKPSPINLVRGMRDILNPDWAYRDKIYAAAKALATDYEYDRIETPVMEETGLFLRGIGKMTDIVEKEMYSFETAGGDKVTLRPEGTAAVARAYIQHGMVNRPQPVKLWYWGDMYRHDRPQSGRYRQFTQFGCECVGDAAAVLDAQQAFLAWKTIEMVGVEAVVHINSIGTPECRVNYKNALVAYFRSKKHKLSEEDKKRLVKNPMRLLDSKDPGMDELKLEAPQIVDWLDEASKAHFMQVLEYLDEMGVPYQLDPYLVRGLDYYTKTVFEIYAVSEDPEASKLALGGGGRYDGLIETIGGNPTPACGFSIGVDRVVNRLKEIDPEAGAISDQRDVYVAQLGDQGRKKAFAIFEALRSGGIPPGASFSKDAIKTQMELANKRGAKWAIIVGQKEVLDGTAIIRDMDAGTQETVDSKKIVHEIKKKLKIAE
ncbi:MAG: histidine--tRNA ligase [Patescibacteria group bacterium]